jgi:hypothetical protein
MKKEYDGINIQYPISELILNESKIVETRTYKIPEHYLNREMLLIETPGPKGKFKARATAIIKFTKCFKYKTKKEFYADTNKHCVTRDSIWAWKDGEKWGWEVSVIKIISPAFQINQHGIVYRRNIPMPQSFST